MSTHACEWASQQGYELKLSPAERVTLWQIARRAATKGFCWPSITTLRDDTGLARQTLLTVVGKLAARGLIRIEKDGQRQFYHLVQSVQNETDRSKSEPVDNSVTGLKSSPNRSNPCHPTGLNLNPNLKENQKKNLKAREASPTGEAASGQRAEAAPSAAPDRLDQEAPPPVVEAEPSVDVSPIIAAIAAAIRGTRAPPPPSPEEPYAPIRRGPVEPERTVEQQQAILAAMIAEEALVQASRGMVAAE